LYLLGKVLQISKFLLDEDVTTVGMWIPDVRLLERSEYQTFPYQVYDWDPCSKTRLTFRAGMSSSCLRSNLIFTEKNRSKSKLQDWTLISAYQPRFWMGSENWTNHHSECFCYLKIDILVSKVFVYLKLCVWSGNPLFDNSLCDTGVIAAKQTENILNFISTRLCLLSD
jgi:hypothetical protein